MTTTMNLIIQQLGRLIPLKQKPVLVAGGGDAAAAKIEALIETGAHIHVIAPHINAEVARFFPRIYRVEKRRPRPIDVMGKYAVIAATGDPAQNRELALFARAHDVVVFEEESR